MIPDGPTPGSAADVQPEADPEQVARTIVLRRLDSAPRTRHELEELLRKRNIPEDVSARVLDRFTEVGLIDDAAYANAWVGSRQRGKGLAPRALAQELRRKGIDPEIAAAALDQVSDDEIEEAARVLVRKKLRALAGVSAETATRRLVAMLARKGYPSSVCYRVVKVELNLSQCSDTPRLSEII